MIPLNYKITSDPTVNDYKLINLTQDIPVLKRGVYSF